MQDRYLRQALIPQIGPGGQKKLRQTRILVVGCGALGSAQTLLLSRAGFGFLRIVDDDKVELSNLHRQILFNEEDARLGLMKARRAAEHLRKGNSDVEIEAHVQRFDAGSADMLLDGIDLVLDATDNFASRFAINRACVERGIFWVYGGAVGDTGMMMPIQPGQGPCLRCLMPEEPASSPTAAQVGVLNSLTTCIAAMQVQAALRQTLDDPMPVGELIRWDAWNLQIQKIRVDRRPDCRCCCA